MKNLYVFGNPYLEQDRFAIEVARQLSDKVRLVFCRNPDELLQAQDDEILIIDVVKNIKEPVCITDPAQLKTQSMVSLHDFDLGFFLNLLDRMGIHKQVRIIGIPMKGNARQLAREVDAWI